MASTGDNISTLPTDQTEPTYKEKAMLDALYPTESVEKVEKTIQQLPVVSRTIWNSFREIIIGSGLFFVLSLPSIDNGLKSVIKTENAYTLLVAKMLLFAVLFFVLTNVALARAPPQTSSS